MHYFCLSAYDLHRHFSILDYAYDLSYRQIINFNNIGISIMQGLTGSFGIVLCVPFTVLFAALVYKRSKS